MTETEYDRMTAGKLYYSPDKDLVARRAATRKLVTAYNQTDDAAGQKALLDQLIDCPSHDAYIEPTIRVDYAKNIHIGKQFYANYDCIFLDVAPITIGDNVMFAPRVGVYTAGHPISYDVRERDLEYGHPITIGSHVWVGGDVTICPGVTIGSDVVIGAESVVTHDIPDHVIAVGNPARVLRKIDDTTRATWAAEEAAYHRETGR
ncbi:sugar O-acetyltransferase [Lacticaseibacillus mingshuiensis]|uniref:Acetyltransferase n=1 Tax=Lacticaseibacillus mingshuiensis TaxID=2799574 RepID=A0ABW4CCX1_9LACO|nr:sugar O-acetyltransferase [Lacticaseibacillus mingshuiensis]